MPAQPFTVHVDPDDLVRRDLAAAVTRSASAPARTGRRAAADDAAPARQGTRDARTDRRAATGRAPVTGGRSYAFRRH